MCHMALQEDLDFSTFENFKTAATRIDDSVCKGVGRSMPHAQVPFEKFWTSTIPDAAAAMVNIGITSCSP